jgi:hypothetical protein
MMLIRGPKWRSFVLGSRVEVVRERVGNNVPEFLNE